MAKEPPQTIGDLRQKAIVTDAEIAQAVEAFLATPKAAKFEFASGHVIDVRAAVNAYRPTRVALAGQITSDAFRRTIVRRAVMLTTPTAK